jgi:hypothetical protein
MNCVIAGNSTSECAGGLGLWEASNVTIRGCTIVGNSSAHLGGGLGIHDSLPLLDGCTIVANRAGGSGGGITTQGSANPMMRDCVVWGNTAPAGRQIAQEPFYPGRLTVEFSDVQGGPNDVYYSLPADGSSRLFSWGAGNIDVDPCFADPNGPDGDSNTWQDNDYHLSANSPCVNAGDPNGEYAGQTDVDGEPRVGGGRVDMGSDEYWARYSLALSVVKPEWGSVVVEPNQTEYLSGSGVVLAATPIEGKAFSQWTVYDPNYPGDLNFATHDTNTVIRIRMDADMQVEAAFKCSGGVVTGLPLMGVGLLAMRLLRRRR